MTTESRRPPHWVSELQSGFRGPDDAERWLLAILDAAWLEGYRYGYESPDMPSDHNQYSPYSDDLELGVRTGEGEHDPAEHRPAPCPLCHGNHGWTGFSGAWETCPRCRP